MKRRSTKIYRGGAVRDAKGCRARPGVVAVTGGQVAYAGSEKDLPRSLRDAGSVVDRSSELLMPALVNAHAHLDLTGLGPRPYEGDFVAWLRQVVADRPTEPDAIAAAVHRGLELSRMAGVGWIGDIAGSADAIRARREGPGALRLPGVSYLECFGIGAAASDVAKRVEGVLESMEFEVEVPGEPRGTVLGLGPHAPYSVGKEAYDALARLSQRRIYRLTTHLAESPEELEFQRDATGPFAELLRELGKWDDTIKPTSKHPINWLEPALRHGRWLAVHCNYVEDEHIRILERTGTSVAYCPIASDYFGHPREGQHRYRDMLAAGVNVCLGTDSILCQPTDSAQPLGILPQMRYLYARRHGPGATAGDGDNARRAGTGISRHRRHASSRCAAIFTAVRIDPDDDTDPLVQVLENDAPAELVEA